MRRPLVAAFFADKITVIAAFIIVLVVFSTVFAPLVAPHDPFEQDLPLRHVPPGFSDVPGRAGVESRFFTLGTDHLGRDLLSRLIYGGRISLTVGVAGVAVSGAIGVFLGLLAGYYRGLLDDAVMRAVDVFMSIPLLMLALLVLFILGPSFLNIILVFAISRWMLYARITRGVVMSLREQVFIEAARTVGCGDRRIIIKHILPNLVTPLMTVAVLEVPRNILVESTLSFLGFGIQPPESSWGLMLAQGREYIISAWWVVAFPGLAIFATALSFNLFGVWMRGVSDPLQRWRWLKVSDGTER